MEAIDNKPKSERVAAIEMIATWPQDSGPRCWGVVGWLMEVLRNQLNPLKNCVHNWPPDEWFNRPKLRRDVYTLHLILRGQPLVEDEYPLASWRPAPPAGGSEVDEDSISQPPIESEAPDDPDIWAQQERAKRLDREQKLEPLWTALGAMVAEERDIQARWWQAWHDVR
jgi:hypothetical protein